MFSKPCGTVFIPLVEGKTDGKQTCSTLQVVSYKNIEELQSVRFPSTWIKKTVECGLLIICFVNLLSCLAPLSRCPRP